MRRLRAHALVGIAALTGLGVVTTGQPPAAAASVAYGKVVFVDDGDTVDVDLRGDGTHRPVRVRYVGVQAMELSSYHRDISKVTGECWGPEAARFLYDLVNGRKVRLTSRLASSHKGSRLHRSVAVLRGGTWRDSGALVVSAGLALPDTGNIEYLRNGEYMALAQQAAHEGRGMWGDPKHCRPGPDQDLPVSVEVTWDAPGNDSANINGEMVRVTNGGGRPLSLAGWWVRDNAYRGTKAHGYTFPAGTVLAPGATVRVHPGHGTDTADDLYWGLDEPIFENVSGPPRNMGDGAYLFDPDGDLRAWQTYPCRYAC